MSRIYYINIKAIIKMNNKSSNRLGSQLINKICKGDFGLGVEVLRFRGDEQNLPSQDEINHKKRSTSK